MPAVLEAQGGGDPNGDPNGGESRQMVPQGAVKQEGGEEHFGGIDACYGVFVHVWHLRVCTQCMHGCGGFCPEVA